MRFKDIFLLSTRMFKARTSRTLLTILGMSIGIGAILFLFSFGYGLQRTILEKIANSDSLLTLDIFETKTSSAILNLKTLENIKNMEGVEKVSPAFQISAQGRMNNLSTDLIAIGTDPLFIKFGGKKILEGKSLDNSEESGILITPAIAKLFGKENINDMLGDEVSFIFFLSNKNKSNIAEEDKLEKIEWDKKYKIIGIIEGGDNTFYVNSNSLKELGIDKFSQFKIKCQSQSTLLPVRDNLTQEGFLVSALTDTVDQANKIFGLIQLALTFFGVIALLVSAIGMFNTMTIALLERTEEIGIMKSIGASDKAVAAMFIMESTIMGFLGGLFGVIIGVAGGEIFDKIINLLAAYFGGEKVNLFYSPFWFILAIITFAAIVGLFTGFFPARRASKINPLDALRYK